MNMQPDTSKCQKTEDQSNRGNEVHVPKEHCNQLTKFTEKKYYIHITGKIFKVHEDIIKNLQETSDLVEVKSVNDCDFIVEFCTIVSRAGTNIEAALKELNALSESKPAIFMVLHHTIDAEKIVPDSSRCVNRSNTLTVDFLFHEDEGWLRCIKNHEAEKRIQQWLLPQNKEAQEEKMRDESSHNSKQYTKLLNEIDLLLEHNDQTDLSIASELRIVLLGMSESVKSAARNIILGEEQKSQAGISTATQNIAVESGTVSVIDTPDWFSSGLSLEKIKQHIQFSISLCFSGPYVFLLVIPVKQFTKEERKIVENMERCFEESGWERVMILFIITDEQEKQRKDMVIQNLGSLLQKCENRFSLSEMGNSNQVLELLEKIEKMVAGKREISIVKSEQKRKRNYFKQKLPKSKRIIWISECPSKDEEKDGFVFV